MKGAKTQIKWREKKEEESDFYHASLCDRRRRQWQPTPVLLPGKPHGRRSLVGCSPWGHEESDTTERLHSHFSCLGEGNGNPLQCSCLENPRGGEAWWGAVYGVALSHDWRDLAAAMWQDTIVGDWMLYLTQSHKVIIIIPLYRWEKIDLRVGSLFNQEAEPGFKTLTCSYQCGCFYYSALPTLDVAQYS